MNTELKNRIATEYKNLDEGQSKKLFLKNTDVLRVSRWIKNGLDDRDFCHLTVKEAIVDNQWDTCRGTMAYSINVATERDNDHRNTIYGKTVYFDGKRAYVLIEKNYDYEQ